MRCTGFLLPMALLALGAGVSNAASPSITSATPSGGQRGAEFEITLEGANLKDAQELMFYSSGITCSKLNVVSDSSVKVQLKAAADCAVGEHCYRLRSARGVSELHTVWISALPCVLEVEPNNSRESAQKIPMNVTVMGDVESGDDDYYQVELKKGDRLSLEIEAVRLGVAMTDTVLTVFDPSGKQLVSVDDSALFKQDGIVSLLAPADGAYCVEVRESSSGRGSGGGPYRLHVGSFPRPAILYPAGGQAGQEVAVQFRGDATGDMTRKVKLPATAAPGFGLFAEDMGGISPSALPFRVSSYPNVLEVEPNDDFQHATPSGVKGPIAFNGVIEKPGDIDCFRFTAVKGEAYDISVFAYKIGSPLDSILSLFDAKGNLIASSDDDEDFDSHIRFTARDDGDHVLRITDKLGKGGPGFVYRIEIEKPQPSLKLFFPHPIHKSQENLTVAVPKGGRATTFMAVQRRGFDAAVAFKALNLPPGVTMHAGPIEPGRYLVPIVFEASLDASVGGRLVSFEGASADPKQPVKGGFVQKVDLVTGPADALYHGVTLDKLAIAVVEESPIAIRLVEPTVPLVQDGRLNVKVLVERAGGFTGPVAVHFTFLPPWVESPPKVTIPADKSEAVVPLEALPEAEPRSWQLVAEARPDDEAASGRTGGRRVQRSSRLGGTRVASQFISITIAKPFVTGKFEPGIGEQGGECKVTCKLDPTSLSSGRVKAKLLRLPPRVTAQDVEIDGNAKEVSFPVKIAADGPLALHGQLVAELTIVKDGQEVIHYVGRGGTLKVEVPGGRLVDEKGRPLTKLEALRLEEARKKNRADK